MLYHLEIANAALKKALARSVDQAEVYLTSEKRNQIDVLDQKVETLDQVQELGMAVRVIKDQRLGFSYSSDLDINVIDEVIDQAVANAACAAVDGSNVLPGPPGQIADLPLYDPAIAITPVQKKIELALKVEETAYRTDPRIKKTEKVTYADVESEVWIINSNGLNAHFRSNYCGAHADVIAEKDGEMESGFGLGYFKNFGDLKAEEIGQEAAQKAVLLLGAKTIPSQKLPLIFDPWVGTQFLEVLSNALSSEAVQKGKSLFAGRAGKIIGAGTLNIIDNGRLSNGLAAAPFDGEGVATQETRLIDSGVLRSFLYNSYTAHKESRRSTGNAVRASFKSLPAVAPTNLYIDSGIISPDVIIRSVARGLYITRVMGIHTANPISGDFSLGAAGIMIENGERTYPVRGITVAGNLMDLLRSIEAIGSNLRFFTTLGSPTLLVSDLAVGGT
jgi:PmbA protein